MRLLVNITDEHANGMLIPTLPALHHFHFQWRVRLTRYNGFRVIKKPLLPGHKETSASEARQVDFCSTSLSGPFWAGRDIRA